MCGFLGVGRTVFLAMYFSPSRAAHFPADAPAQPGERHVFIVVEIELPGQRRHDANARSTDNVVHLTGNERTLMLFFTGRLVLTATTDLPRTIDREFEPARTRPIFYLLPLGVKQADLIILFAPGASTTSNGTTCTVATF